MRHVICARTKAETNGNAVQRRRGASTGEADGVTGLPTSDRIFRELAKFGKIKFSHIILSIDELKRHAYYKLHNTFSHATNDCNIFRRQIQSAINEGRLVISGMQINQNHFPMHTHVLEMKNLKVLIQPNQQRKKCDHWRRKA